MGKHDPDTAPQPVHRAMMVADIDSFAARTDAHQHHLRETLYRLMADAFVSAGVPWDSCYLEDRGDGVLVVLPPGLPADLLVGPLVLELSATARRHNRLATDAARLRLRMAVHAGYVHFSWTGVASGDLEHVFRLVEAPVFKEAFRESDAEVGLIVSDLLYDSVVRHGLGMLDPAAFRTVRAQDTNTRGWMYLPDPPTIRPRADIPRGLPGQLSPREVEVAGLVAEGYTNVQIAALLFLSVRTVETHVSRVFAKLHVSSRVGVATALSRTKQD